VTDCRVVGDIGRHDQGDQIGRIFAFCAIILCDYFVRLFSLGSFLEITEVAQICGVLFSTGKVVYKF
jgi:hypothetical protein